MKAFYFCTDGFCLFWSYEYSGDSKLTTMKTKNESMSRNCLPIAVNDIKRVGKIHIPHLIQITLVRENLESIVTNPSNNGQVLRPGQNDAIPTLNISSKSKIFELSTILDLAKVCLIYETPESIPKIYLLELETLKCQFLADTFSEYLRMAIAHLGLPYWELCFSSVAKLPPWTQQLFLLLAPHLLENGEPRRSEHCFHNGNDMNPPLNTLDPSVFRSKPRVSRQNPKTR